MRVITLTTTKRSLFVPTSEASLLVLPICFLLFLGFVSTVWYLSEINWWLLIGGALLNVAMVAASLMFSVASIHDGCVQLSSVTKRDGSRHSDIYRDNGGIFSDG